MLRTTATDAKPSGALRQVVDGDRVIVVTVDDKGKENTVLIPIPAQAGYSVAHNEAVFLQDMKPYRIPGFEHGTYRAFEVSGDSMEPTINHRDIVVASFVDKWSLLKPDEIYVVVTSENVLLKRIPHRIVDMNKPVQLLSDNPHRRPYSVDAVDITELWMVRGYVSTYIPTRPDITSERLWEVIELLGHDRMEVRRYLEEHNTDAG
ncbi:S24 family peptidase [Hymenobacter sp.]|uniref:S24 family peptidase n=1 Tax=Hymenobacter sp. TaxID=1898978 RepID=UPI002ED8B3A3